MSLNKRQFDCVSIELLIVNNVFINDSHNVWMKIFFRMVGNTICDSRNIEELS
jgi:hypothetical protein